MNLPPELFVKIVEFLPDEVIFNLWCTGRELHGIKSIYIQKILPYIKKTSLLKLKNYQKSFYIEIDDGGPLKEYGIINCRLNIINETIILNLDNNNFVFPKYPFCALHVFKLDQSIVVTASFFSDNYVLLYKKGYYCLEKIEFTTRYYFFSLLKLKLKQSVKLCCV